MTFWKPLTEAVVQRCSVKKSLLKTLQNSQENTCARVFHENFLKHIGLELKKLGRQILDIKAKLLLVKAWEHFDG